MSSAKKTNNIVFFKLEETIKGLFLNFEKMFVSLSELEQIKSIYLDGKSDVES